MVDGNRRFRRSVRLQGYDYRLAGAYFVTICAHKRMCIFGNIDGAEMQLNETGQVIESCWSEIPKHFPVSLDEYVVMPNHVHGIIVMSDEPVVERAHPALGVIVGAFKSAATKRARELHGAKLLPVGQRNYYEHVIRDKADLDRIREYIVENPLRWHQDPENPSAT